jgi:hypothetical protein
MSKNRRHNGGQKVRPADDFEAQSHIRQPGLLAEFLQLLLHSKKWWLAPIVLVLLVLGLLVLLAGSPLAPWIYTVF